MKRAANQMGEGFSVPKGQNDQSLQKDDMILGSKTTTGQASSNQKSADRVQDKSQEKSKMTRFSNGVAPAVNGNGSNAHTTAISGAAASATATAAAVNQQPAARASSAPAQAVQQLQIVRLLQDLGERLRQSEKEREILWKEVDGCRKLLTDIEDKTSKTEKAYLQLEHKVSNRPTAGSQEDMDKLSKTLQEKIDAIETTAGSAILRIEDAISENSKLARRLDQVTQDKTLLLRKLDTMEATLTQTQDALKAKALVLLTDAALANRTGLPQTQAWAGNDTLRMQPQASPMTAQPAPQQMVDQGGLFRRGSRINMNTALLVSLVALGVGGGWAISKLQVPDLGPSGLFQDSKTEVSDKSQEQLMADIAKQANEIEPSAEDETNNTNAIKLKPDELLAQQAEKAAIATFNGETRSGDVSDRIEADKSLPKVVKDIENRAFDGDAEAQHDLAAIYTAGHAGVKTDYARAAQWFDEAAHNGVANAQYNLGVLYHQGLGVKQDTRKAIQLYRVAAANGHPEAEYNLGIAHIEGVGADYSPRVATKYFEQAASGGIVEAAYNLGLIEENGLLGDARPDEAIFWYKTASDQGNLQAKQALTQLQKARRLTDQDVARIHNRIAVLKPNAFHPKEMSAAEKAATTAVEPETVEPAAPAKKADATPAKTKARYETVIVTQIQEQLTRMGLYSGDANGEDNAATEEAVKQYQTMNKLKADGNPTEDVLVHMLANEMQDPAAGE